MMSQRDFYTLELFSKIKPIFSKIKPILKQSFLLDCPTELIKFFCNCMFNVLHGGIRMTANVSVKKLKRHQSNIETLCKNKCRIRRKRQLLATKNGTKLLKLIEPSVLNDLRKRLDIKQ